MRKRYSRTRSMISAVAVAAALAAVSATALFARELPEPAADFRLAEQQLLQLVFRSPRRTPLCGCGFTADGVSAATDGADCGGGSVRAVHLFPPARFNQNRRCWTRPESFPGCFDYDGSIIDRASCCARVDPVVGSIHHDLVNLWPMLNDLAPPSGYRWGDVETADAETLRCGVRLDRVRLTVEPPAARRGDLARAMLYVSEMYELPLTRDEQLTFRRWAREDPADGGEKERNARIKTLQERANPVLD